jgi:putative glutamine amidotransferase
MYWLDIAPWSIETATRANRGGESLDHWRVWFRRAAADYGGMRPLIGVTTSELRPSTMATTRRQGEPAHPEMALGMTYLRTLDEAGAMPVVLPPVISEVDALLDRLDGVVLSGGPDLDPAAYGARERHPELGPTEPSLDAFELALAAAALERGTPILAVCRGAQALNVACGGTLHQHIPGHRQTAPAREWTHQVQVAARSRLARILHPGALPVNSFHHQAVDRLGAGLQIVATAPDGTVEAIEGAGFVIGVQWHAETLPAHRRLFDALVAAASSEPLRAAA